jgi:hypothetical protein
MESQPGLAAGAEHAEALGEDRKCLMLGVFAAGVTGQNAPHLEPPDILEVCPDVAPVIRDEDPLEEVIAGVMPIQIVLEGLQASGIEEDMAVHDQDIIPLGMLEDGVSGRAGPDGLAEGDVMDGAFRKRDGAAIALECLGHGQVRGIIDNQDLAVLEGLLVMDQKGLDGEVDAVEVRIGRHADREFHRTLLNN